MSTHVYLFLKVLEKYFDKKQCYVVFNIRNKEEKSQYEVKQIIYFEQMRGTVREIFEKIYSKYKYNCGMEILKLEINNKEIQFCGTHASPYDEIPYKRHFSNDLKSMKCYYKRKLIAKNSITRHMNTFAT